MKVTDLEKFVLQQIFWPYSSILNDKPIDKLNKEYNLDTALSFLKENREWRKLVMNRLCKLNLNFPSYIKHPLIDFIKIYIKTEKRVSKYSIILPAPEVSE